MFFSILLSIGVQSQITFIYSLWYTTLLGISTHPSKRKRASLIRDNIHELNSLELVSGNCCVLIQTNVGNCAFNVKMKKHCAQYGRCLGSQWMEWAYICERMNQVPQRPGPCRVGPKRASELGGASEINDPSFMFNLFES